MVGRFAAAARVEVAEQLGGPDLGLAGEDAEGGRLGFDGVGDDEVELGPVAGRDRRRLVDPLGGGQLAQGADGAALGQREALAQVERGGLVGDAQGEELSSSARTSSRSAAASPPLPRCSAKPASSRSSRSIRCSGRHDRDVDDDQDEEDDVGTGDVLARLVERQGRSAREGSRST